MKAAQLQKASSGLNVGVHIYEGILDRGAHTGAGGHVHHPLYAFGLKNAGDEGCITQVTLKETDPIGAVLLEEHGDV